MAKCPFAVQKPVPIGGNDPKIAPRVAIFHVDAGNASSLWGLFTRNNKKGGSGIESTFFIRNDGVLEQYRDTTTECDANYKANPFAVSIETQGYGNGKWNPKQLATLKRLISWLHDVHPAIVLQKVQKWNGAGFGYHTQFGAPGPWTPVAKSCPGPKRIKQYNDILVPYINNLRRLEQLEKNASKKRPALGKYKTRRKTNKRALPATAAKVLSYLRPGATVNITDVDWDDKGKLWYGAYKTSLRNKRWIPMRSADVIKL